MKNIVISVFIAIAMATNAGCVFSHVTTLNPANSNVFEPPKKEPYRLLVLSQGAPCKKTRVVESKSWDPNSKKYIIETRVRCYEFYERGWYPVELLEAESWNRNEFSLKGERLVKKLENEFNGESGIIYQRVENLNEYGKIKKTNLIEHKVYSTRKERHWSLYLAVVTIGVIPGFDDYMLRSTVTIYDSKGKGREISPETKSIRREWGGWIFFIWGMIASSDRADLVFDDILAKMGRDT